MISRIPSALLAVVIAIGGSVMAQTPEAADVKVNSSMLVSSDWLATHLHDSSLVILCVAGDRTFYDRHIPGARFIPLDKLVSQGATLNAIPPLDQLKGLFEGVGIDRDSRIVLYGDRRGLLAARAYMTLDYAGLADHAALLDGGIEKWRAENREESAEVTQVRATRLELSPNTKMLVALEEMKAHASRGDATLVDARPHVEFSGERRSEDVPRAGHIRGASGLYWMDLLRSREIPTLKPAAELLKAFSDAGATRERDVIAYCRTGMQASVDYFVAKYLGFPTRIYVPSFYEYSRSDGAVERSMEPSRPK